jgi:hypothetical protein
MRHALLMALGEAIVGEQAEPALVSRIEDVLSAMPADNRVDFEKALRLFASPLGGLLSFSTWRSFATASLVARRKRLSAFQSSSLPLFRTIYLAIQRVVVSAHYADPSVQRVIGFIPPEVEH